MNNMVPITNKLDATFWLSCMRKATLLLLIQKDSLISALSEEYLTTISLSSLTKCVQQILQEGQTKGKLKHCLENNNNT